MIKKASPLFKFDPYLDDQGMLRVGGRLEQADFSIEVKHPIILPRAGHVSLLIVRHYHEITHQGRGITTNARCDRGTNFVGAKNELAREYEAMDQNKIKKYLQDHNCDYFELNSMSHKRLSLGETDQNR